MDFRKAVAGTHDVRDAHGDGASDGAGGMETSVFLLGEAAELEKGHREGVAEREGGRGTGGGREVEGAGFARDAHGNGEVGKFREG